MTVCPFCKAEIDGVIAKFEGRRITKYLIHNIIEGDMEVERWDAIDSRVTEDSLGRCSVSKVPTNFFHYFQR